VEPIWVIKVFDIIIDSATCVRQVGEGAAVDEFGFEGAPEGFHGGVVVAVAAAAHAGDDLIRGQ